MNNDNEIDAQKLGNNINELTSVLSLVTDEIWKTERYVLSSDRYYYTIFMKLQMLLDGIYIQVYNLDHKPHFGIGVALQLRTAMLDIMGLYYLLDEIDDEKELSFRLNTIMADHLKYVWNDLNSEQKSAIVLDWPELVDSNLNLNRYPIVNTKLFFKGITKKTSLVNEVKEVRHIYDIFSKLEHNGAFTFDLLHNSYYPGGDKKMKFMIKASIIACTAALNLVSSHWLESGSPLIEKLDCLLKVMEAV